MLTYQRQQPVADHTRCRALARFLVEDPQHLTAESLPESLLMEMHNHPVHRARLEVTVNFTLGGKKEKAATQAAAHAALAKLASEAPAQAAAPAPTTKE